MNIDSKQEPYGYIVDYDHYEREWLTSSPKWASNKDQHLFIFSNDPVTAKDITWRYDPNIHTVAIFVGLINYLDRDRKREAKLQHRINVHMISM